MDNLYGFNMSQPEYNDLRTVLESTVEAGIPLLELDRHATEMIIERSAEFKGLVCLSRSPAFL